MPSSNTVPEQEQEDSVREDQTSLTNLKETKKVVVKVPILIRKECPPWVRQVVSMCNEYPDDVSDTDRVQQVLRNHTSMVWDISESGYVVVTPNDMDADIVFAFDTELVYLTEVSVESKRLP